MVTKFTGLKAFADPCLYEFVLVCEFYPPQFVCTFQIHPVCILREQEKRVNSAVYYEASQPRKKSVVQALEPN
jgi:hypothetical protein